jgi:hypothetical protein
VNKSQELNMELDWIYSQENTDWDELSQLYGAAGWGIKRLCQTGESAAIPVTALENTRY